MRVKMPPSGERSRASSVLLDERELQEIERTWPNGLTSRQIVDVFETRGIRFSEATLRKYVQLGLLPRSVRVGPQGQAPRLVRRLPGARHPARQRRQGDDGRGPHHRGDPAVVRALQGRHRLGAEGAARPDRELRARGEGPVAATPTGRRELEHEIIEAKSAAGELVRRISSLERRISKPAPPTQSAGGTAVGGGHDLY